MCFHIHRGCSMRKTIEHKIHLREKSTSLMTTMSCKSCIERSISIYNPITSWPLMCLLISIIHFPPPDIGTLKHEYIKCPSNLPLTNLSDKMGKDGGKRFPCFMVSCHHSHIKNWMHCYQMNDLSIHVNHKKPIHHTNQSP